MLYLVNFNVTETLYCDDDTRYQRNQLVESTNTDETKAIEEVSQKLVDWWEKDNNEYGTYYSVSINYILPMLL